MSKQSMGQKRCLKENKKQTKQNYIELSDGDGGFHYAISSSSTPFSDSGSASHTAPGIPWSSEAGTCTMPTGTALPRLPLSPAGLGVGQHAAQEEPWECVRENTFFFTLRKLSCSTAS